jgi:hypothetical protein
MVVARNRRRQTNQRMLDSAGREVKPSAVDRGAGEDIPLELPVNALQTSIYTAHNVSLLARGA